jgi:predicted RNase H-like nuclease (RuvC/YqgF family)
MNSEINRDAQFIMTSHDVKLLSPQLFRKDQINFILRDDCQVEIVTLDDFKANSNRDIRSNSNFEKMYVEEKIVPLPDTDIYQVIKEFSLYDEKKTNKN